MDIWTFILLVTAIGCSIPLSKLWLDHRARVTKASAWDGSLARDVAALKARVATLEEIVTDKRYHLDREIKALDDTG